MTHLWQHHHGKPGRSRYHNREWAEKMKAIGLQPTDTGEEGGKETGDSVHHLIIPNGKFDRVATELIKRGFTIAWTERPILTPTNDEGENEDENDKDGSPKKENKSGKRVKYVCPHEACDLKAWAKHDARLVCGDHMQVMEPSA
jgi:hypothetical protein